ncbi:hypothetical protein F5148DRAFT_1180877 [Russula earlei]|uniref:Uncharacterized protein n=1 Tax=Russula earlei TaxID=71964 RepID=A0ACC0UF73_9AGAM|nr:hypothetical protein F5148DRAFT_1180877 [Russula earlei]
MTMTMTEISRQLRLYLEGSSQALSAQEVFTLVDNFVSDCNASDEPDVSICQLENELQVIRDTLDLSESLQTEALLSVLRHLEPVLSSTSLISTWFDLVLRPALRGPRLSYNAISQAKDLVVVALEKPDTRHPEIQGEFRRRILDLYLLDASNEASAEEVLEWADLPREQRDQRKIWKENLEDILIAFGMDQPEAFLMQVFHCFPSPSSRLQLIGLLNRVLASHPLMSSILTSLLVDNSPTASTISLTTLTKLLPMFAVKDCSALKRLLPHLFAILARVLCWPEDAPPASTHSPPPEGVTSDEEHGMFEEEYLGQATYVSRALDVNPDLQWERLDLSFDSTAAPPSSQRYFTFLYFLFPCNLIAFLRDPVGYLSERNVERPYAVDWEDALDHEQIKTKSELLLRQHVTHPQLIWRRAESEISEPGFFSQYDTDRVVAEALLLELRHSHVVSNGKERPETALLAEFNDNITAPLSVDTSDAGLGPMNSTPPIQTVEIHSKPRVSLQDMVNTSIALKSRLDVDIVDPTPIWPYSLFPADARLQSPGKPEPGSSVVQAIAGLQREVLLLRNELNFELWLARENVRQIGRLFEQRITSRNAEVERQNLHNKLRENKVQIGSLQRKLKEHTEHSEMTKKKYADWNAELSRKLQDLREQKRNWVSETAALRLAEKELRAQFVAQGNLLAEAERRESQLRTSIKETEHKVARLKDYEQRIEQHATMQRLWDVDVQKYKEQTEAMRVLLSKYKKMELRLDAYEKTHSAMEEQARTSRRQIQTMEARLKLTPNRAPHRTPRTSSGTEFSRLREENAKLHGENVELKDEIEELKAMVEMLRAQARGHSGLLSEPSRSPIIGGAVLRP